ncbi:RICIN domain-containing protein [Kitasatospora purpeofusca]|uniref:RICIN domain-containing protein n=1 Tax=Kitasatospora purpeofusca TaxID=67352 RepID=UPI0035D8B238
MSVLSTGPAHAGNDYGPPGFVFVNRLAGRCLEVADWSMSPGAAVRLWDCHGGRNQRWYRKTTGEYVNVNSGFCLDVPGWSTVATRLIQWPCTGGANQRWGTTQAGWLPGSGDQLLKVRNDFSWLALQVTEGTWNGVPVVQDEMATSGGVGPGSWQQWYQRY